MIIKSSAGLKVFILPASVVLVIIIGVFYIKPTFDEIGKAKQTTKENQELLEKLSAQNKSLTSIKDGMASMTEDKALVQIALPEKESADYYISELYNRANRNGVLLTSVTVPGGSSNQCNSAGGGQESAEAASPATAEDSGSSASSDGQNVLPVQSMSSCLFSSTVEVGFKGTWEQLLSFLKSINDMNRISDVEKIGIVSTVQKNEAGEETSDLLTVSISADIYFKDMKKEIGQNTISSLASQGTFSDKNIEKIKSAIRYQFNPPTVSEFGERNIFK